MPSQSGSHICASTPDDVVIEILPSTAREDVKELWIGLETSIDRPGLTCSWMWTSAWLDVYGLDVPHWFAVGYTSGMPVGVVLLTCSSLPALGSMGIGIIHLGTDGEPRGHSVDVEYNRLLVHDRHQPAFLSALLKGIEDKLHPVGIRMKSFLPSDIALATSADDRFTSTPQICPVFDLRSSPNSDHGVLPRLRSSVRSRVRRSNKELSPLHTEWANSNDHALDIYDELVSLHQVRWRRAGRPGAFSSSRFEAFHRQLITQLLSLGKVILFRVRNDDKTVGCLYSFVDNGMVMFYQSGFAEFENNKIKPGLTTHVLCMQHCSEHGFHTYNFLAGDQRYKSELATGTQELLTAHAWQHAFVEPVVTLFRSSGALDSARKFKRWRERIAIGSTS